MKRVNPSKYSGLFAQNLRVIMARDSLTCEGLARKMGTTGRRVGEWRHGKGEPKAQELARLADALDVSMDVLLGRDGLPKGQK